MKCCALHKCIVKVRWHIARPQGKEKRKKHQASFFNLGTSFEIMENLCCRKLLGSVKLAVGSGPLVATLVTAFAIVCFISCSYFVQFPQRVSFVINIGCQSKMLVNLLINSRNIANQKYLPQFTVKSNKTISLLFIIIKFAFRAKDIIYTGNHYFIIPLI